MCSVKHGSETLVLHCNKCLLDTKLSISLDIDWWDSSDPEKSDQLYDLIFYKSYSDSPDTVWGICIDILVHF